MVNLIISSVATTLKLQRRCPHCGRNNDSIHSAIRRGGISDIKVSHVIQRRMKCPHCGTTWTIRAQGVSDGRQRSDRLISLGVVLYMFGLSCRRVAEFLPLLDCSGSKSSIERDICDAGQKARELHFNAPKTQVRVLGVDGTGAKMAGKRRSGMLFFVDVEKSRLICVEPVNETDAERVRRHVLRVMRQVQAEDLMADEAYVYDSIVDEDNRRICLAHWRKSKINRASEMYRQAKFEQLEYAARDMQDLISLLRQDCMPQKIPEAVEKLVRRYSDCPKGILGKINQLMQHIERTWAKVGGDFGVRTNNATE